MTTTRPADIEDENLTDHIIDDLYHLGLIEYESISRLYRTDDLPAVIARVTQLDRQRLAQYLRTVAGGARKTGDRAHADGIVTAAAIVESGGAA